MKHSYTNVERDGAIQALLPEKTALTPSFNHYIAAVLWHLLIDLKSQSEVSSTLVESIEATPGPERHQAAECQSRRCSATIAALLIDEQEVTGTALCQPENCWP